MEDAGVDEGIDGSGDRHHTIGCELIKVTAQVDSTLP